MADKKITDLTEDPASTDNDLVPVVDIETGTTKKVKLINLAGVIGKGLVSGVLNAFANAISNYANAGSAGGTFYYINIAGLKILWGKTASNAVGTGGATVAVTLPTSFFANVRYSGVTLDTIGAEPKQWAYVSAITNTSLSIGQMSNSNGASQVNSVLLIGT